MKRPWSERSSPLVVPLDPEILTAASLAHLGLLGAVHRIRLKDVDLASVPEEHLAALVSCVTDRVNIRNVTNCPTLSIINSVKCKWLGIVMQSLGTEETQALVRALESRVERVYLGNRVSMDIDALTQYGGHGKCWELIYHDKFDRYSYELESWAQRINWAVNHESRSYENHHYPSLRKNDAERSLVITRIEDFSVPLNEDISDTKPLGIKNRKLINTSIIL